MRAEVSCLFHLKYHDDGVKEGEAHVGGGVYLQEIRSNNWREDLLRDLSATVGMESAVEWLKAREELDWGPYTHRLYTSIENVTSSSDPQIEEGKQRIKRSIVLSRIVHPTPIPRGGTWIETMYEVSGPHHLPEIGVGMYSMAYVAPQSVKTLTRENAKRMAELWEPLEKLFDNKEKYRRIIQALHYFDDGYHIWNAEFRHLVFHAALSALIFTGGDSIKAQIAQRLPRLVPGITEREALAIHNLCDDMKHEATPLEANTIRTEEMRPGEERPHIADLFAYNQERRDAVESLEKALRSLLEQAISDLAFADLLADRGEFARQYPVEISKSSIGDFIIRDQGVRGGRPIIDGTGITVNRIATWYNLGLRPEEISARIGHVSLAQVYAALAHYHANRDEIDDEIAAEEAEADRLEQEHYASLQSR